MAAADRGPGGKGLLTSAGKRKKTNCLKKRWGTWKKQEGSEDQISTAKGQPTRLLGEADQFLRRDSRQFEKWLAQGRKIAPPLKEYGGRWEVNLAK